MIEKRLKASVVECHYIRVIRLELPLSRSTMSSARPEQPHLVSLVLQSKKALQHGEQLCSRANSLSNASAQCAVDVLALDAKVKWISAAVIDQLKVFSITYAGLYWLQ